MFMPAHLAPAEPDCSPTDKAAADALYYRGALHALIDMGVDLARLLHQAAVAHVAVAAAEITPQHAPELANELAHELAPEITGPFERVARTVRRTVMLARKIAEPVVAARPANPAPDRAATRRRIIREVEDAIQRAAVNDAAETLHVEFLDRLDAPDLDAEIAHRPASEIIADICRDLGLLAPRGTHPWQRRTPEDIATLCARAAYRGVHPAALPQTPSAGGCIMQAMQPQGSDPPAPA